MKRYTIKDAEFWFKRVAELFNRSTQCWRKENDGRKANIGSWELDYNPIYGGCVVHEIVNEAGGVTAVFSSARLSPREFCECMYQIQGAIEIWREQK